MVETQWTHRDRVLPSILFRIFPAFCSPRLSHAQTPVSASRSRVSSASFRGLLPPDRRTGHREIRILFLIRSECSDVSGECVSRARDRALTALSLFSYLFLYLTDAPRRGGSGVT